MRFSVVPLTSVVLPFTHSTTVSPESVDPIMLSTWHLQDTRASPVSSDLSPRFSVDPCETLCDEFSANRRGNGYDLCDDPRQSRCVPYNHFDLFVCSDLYWSTSEDGNPGLVYIVDSANLDEMEASQPVTCAEADRLVFGDNDYYYVLNRTRIIEHSSRIFAHLAPVQRLIRTPEYNDPLIEVFRHDLDESSIDAIDHMLGLDPSEMHAVIDVVEQLVHLSGTDGVIHTGLSSHRQCRTCGLESAVFHPIMVPGLPVESNETLALENLLASITRPAFSMITFCDDCDRHTSTQELRRVIQPAQVYVIVIDPLLSENVSYPPRLNMWAFAQIPGNQIYELVAYTDRRNDIGLLVNGTWVVSDESGGLTNSGRNESTITSNSITAIIYQQIV